MFDNIVKLFKRFGKKEPEELTSKQMAKERLHLVLMQDRANVSADFLDMMKQEIIDVIKKYIDVEDKDIDVRLTNKMNEDGTTGAPALYANIPIAGIKQNVQNTSNKIEVKENKSEVVEEKVENKKIEVDKEKKEEKQNKDEIKSENKKEEKASNKVVNENTTIKKNSVNKEKTKNTKTNTKKNTKSTKSK